MKRAHDTEAPEGGKRGRWSGQALQKGARPRGDLTRPAWGALCGLPNDPACPLFIALAPPTALGDVKACGPGAWRAAKETVLHGAVRLTAAEEASSGLLTLAGVVSVAAGSPLAQSAHHAPTLPPSVAVEVALDASSGELLDARTSCCPGGFHAVLGSFCPCVGALLLQAAAEARAPGGLQPRPALRGRLSGQALGPAARPDRPACRG